MMKALLVWVMAVGMMGCTMEVEGEFEETLDPETLIGVCVDHRDGETWTIRRKDVTRVGLDTIGPFIEIETEPGVPLRIHPGDNRAFIKCRKDVLSS